MGDPYVRTLTRLARMLERRAGDLSLPQFRVLALVDEGGERASQLAERLAVAKPTITAVVDGLVERGYVKRSADCDDRRATNITRHPKAAIWPWLLLLVLAGVIRFGAAYVRRFYGGRVALSVQHDLRTAIYDTLQRLDFARHDELQTGQLVSRASSDVALLQGLLAFLPIISGNLVMLVISLVIMVILSPMLTLVALAVVPLLFVVALRMRRSAFPARWVA